jgi:DNA end-binding protein Ku
MEETGKVGVARFVMRSKQYLCAVRPKDGMLLMSTMVYADEVNAPQDIKELDSVTEVEVTDKELTMAKQLVESLASDFEAGQYEDTYRTKVLELIERKAAGETGLVEVPEVESDEKVVDLMAALEASVAAAKAARKSTAEKPAAKKRKSA